jgi:hypothetical protein
MDWVSRVMGLQKDRSKSDQIEIENQTGIPLLMLKASIGTPSETWVLAFISITSARW